MGVVTTERAEGGVDVQKWIDLAVAGAIFERVGVDCHGGGLSWGYHGQAELRV